MAAEIITAVAGAVTAGTSLASITGVFDDKYLITVRTEVDNLANCTLVDPTLSMNSGECEIPPVRIAPGYKEAMLTRKHNITATGSFGVVSWRIGDTEQRVVIMWSVPYDYNLYDNWLAVGMKTTKTHDPNWANDMYDAAKDRGTWFERAKYSTNVPTVSWSTDQWAVSATMSTTHHAVVRVTFAPTRWSDVAKCLLDKAVPKEKSAE